MTTSTTPLAPRTSPPVHQHRDWRHLQRAAIAAHRPLADVTQAQFCALMVPAASIAVWILQHAPHLAQRSHLRLLVAQATEYQALDRGRWMQFIPWLVGRPDMRIDVTLVGDDLLPDRLTPNGLRLAPESEAALEGRHRTHSSAAVRSFTPATLHQGSVADWLERTEAASTDAPALPDLCAVFSPTLLLNHAALLSDDGLLPLLRRQVPLALFSASEAEQLVDVFAMQAAGLVLRDPECWPNPWALPTQNAERVSVYAKMGWAAEADAVHPDARPDAAQLRELEAALGYIERGTFDRGPDAILALGEPLRTAALQPTGSDTNEGSVLLRLPRGVAVDGSNGYVYQLQDVSALLVESVPQVPRAVLESFPGDDLLRRAMWAVAVHRDFVEPFVQRLDDALMSQFTRLDAAVGA